MTKEYRELFQMVAQSAAVNAENGMDVFRADKEENHVKELEDLTLARDRLLEIKGKLDDENVVLNKHDFLLLYTGAMVCTTTLERNINTWQSVVKEYRENLLPRLKNLLLEKDEAKYNELLNDYFN